jgi:hypothetical protein
MMRRAGESAHRNQEILDQPDSTVLAARSGSAPVPRFFGAMGPARFQPGLRPCQDLPTASILRAGGSCLTCLLLLRILPYAHTG